MEDESIPVPNDYSSERLRDETDQSIQSLYHSERVLWRKYRGNALRRLTKYQMRNEMKRRKFEISSDSEYMEDEERTRLGLYTNEQYKILKLLSAKCGSPGFLERDKAKVERENAAFIARLPKIETTFKHMAGWLKCRELIEAEENRKKAKRLARGDDAGTDSEDAMVISDSVNSDTESSRDLNFDLDRFKSSEESNSDRENKAQPARHPLAQIQSARTITSSCEVDLDQRMVSFNKVFFAKKGRAALKRDLATVSARNPKDYKIEIIKDVLTRRENGEDTPNSDFSSDEADNLPITKKLKQRPITQFMRKEVVKPKTRKRVKKSNTPGPIRKPAAITQPFQRGNTSPSAKSSKSNRPVIFSSSDSENGEDILRSNYSNKQQTIKDQSNSAVNLVSSSDEECFKIGRQLPRSSNSSNFNSRLPKKNVFQKEVPKSLPLSPKRSLNLPVSKRAKGKWRFSSSGDDSSDG